MLQVRPMSKAKHAALVVLWLFLAWVSFQANAGGCGGIFLLIALAQGYLLYTKIAADYQRSQQAVLPRQSDKPASDRCLTAEPSESAFPTREIPDANRFYRVGDDD